MGQGKDWDNKLFIFSLLISSLFLYNTNTTLSADLFRNLTFMTAITNKIELSGLVTPDASDDEETDESRVRIIKPSSRK